MKHFKNTYLYNLTASAYFPYKFCLYRGCFFTLSIDVQFNMSQSQMRGVGIILSCDIGVLRSKVLTEERRKLLHQQLICSVESVYLPRLCEVCPVSHDDFGESHFCFGE